jgi:hypothetical protein
MVHTMATDNATKAEDIINDLENDGYTTTDGQFWKPEDPGEYLEGVVIGTETVNGDQCAKLDCGDDGIQLIGHSVARDRLVDLQGKQVAVVFKGVKEGENNEYHDYEVLAQ